MFPPSECPCCSYPLLCYVRHGKPFWFCNRCFREMPYGMGKSLAEVEAEIISPVNAPIVLAQPLEPSKQNSNGKPDRSLEEQLIQLQKKQEKLELLQEGFLSTTSHELRTPLSNMWLSIQMLELTLKQVGLLADDQKMMDTKPAGIAHFLKVLKEECKKEIGLINDLLTLQELEAGTQALSPITLPLQGLIAQIIQTYETQALKRQHHFQVDIPSDLPLLSIDFGMVDRLLRELLNNACKFTPTGDTISVIASARRGWIQIRVSNSGVEIPATELERIFDKFYRLSSSDPWKHREIGLGLALAKQMVTYLEGSIWAESSPGQTCFVVELPCQESHEVTQVDMLLGYVAYYVSRGRAIISPVRGPILFDQTVYQYWGYTSDFLHFWRGLQQQRDFDEFYLEDDIATFGEFLHKGRTVQECVRCRLPVPSVEQGTYNSGCPCDQRFFLEQAPPHPTPQIIEAERKVTCVVVIGSLPSDAEILESWFRDNELDVTFVAKLEPMPEQITAQAIDL
ncbi:MAG: HAMP domain-containing sensor histidine kinase, partial [Kovacikia sp.]